MYRGKLIVVSNRLPVTLTRENEVWKAKSSSGGLATAMQPILKETGGVWVGWSGDDGTIDPLEREQLLASEAEGYRCIPVDMGIATDFYEGYPNQTLWPLFHYFPTRMNYAAEGWDAYVEGNRTFGHAVSQIIEGDELIWVHDYHLMLLPECIRGHLRDRQLQAKIGFFLHIPFPSSEVFAMLPGREEVLKGLLGADLIAFHTHHYLQHFRSSLLRILGVESQIDSVDYDGRTIRIEVLPIGISPSDLPSLLDTDPETAGHMQELKSRYGEQKTIIAVDRLDYTKGIPHRMRAYRRLLTQHPELAGKVVMIQVAVPSREGIGEYQELRSELNELVGEINGALATAHWTPIVYLRQGVSQAELVALYATSDIAWVAPLRDGLNLVAKEYCACKPDGDGVLVLSEFAGAAAEMGGALLVNPYNEHGVAEAVFKALQMDAPERRARLQPMREGVLRNNVFVWADRFLDALASSAEPVDVAPLVNFQDLRNRYKNAAKRLLIFDYDGTLVPIVNNPAASKPGPELLRALKRLASSSDNVVAVLSGRRAEDMEKWLGGIKELCLGAEHGLMIRRPCSEDWEKLAGINPDLQWKDKIRPVLEHFVDRAPASVVEEKEFSLVWHYRRVEPEFGSWLAKELLAVLEDLLADSDARPVHGKKIVEVKSNRANKGEFVSQLLENHEPADLVLAIGDDTTDEDMFARLDEYAYTVHVGPDRSSARFHLRSQAQVADLLNQALQ